MRIWRIIDDEDFWILILELRRIFKRSDAHGDVLVHQFFCGLGKHPPGTHIAAQPALRQNRVDIDIYLHADTRLLSFWAKQKRLQ